MEIFDTDNAALILDVPPDTLRELARSGDIAHVGSRQNPQFAWSHLERFIEKEQDIDIFEAQRWIADKIWAEEKVLV